MPETPTSNAPQAADDDRLFVNAYCCPICDYDWQDEYSCAADDDCPQCGARAISPYWSEDADGCSDQPTDTLDPPPETRRVQALTILRAQRRLEH
jgi:hypothetical protein